jgi:hypothetical protein
MRRRNERHSAVRSSGRLDRVQAGNVMAFADLRARSIRGLPNGTTTDQNEIPHHQPASSSCGFSFEMSEACGHKPPFGRDLTGLSFQFSR